MLSKYPSTALVTKDIAQGRRVLNYGFAIIIARISACS